MSGTSAIMGRKVVQVPLTEVWAFPVRRLVEEAAKAGGGLIYLCNPNNPTASTTSNEDIDWLVTNLPPHTTLLVDEAYIHFVQPGEVESAIKYVRQGKDVVVTRTFSKIYGMAGARAGFGCARPDLIRRLQPFVDNVVPVLALRAATAALAERDTLVPTRRTKIAQARKELCDWLTNKNIRFIDPHANFVMNILKPGDLLISVRIPSTWAGAQFFFEKVRDRNVWDFPLLNVASAIKLSGNTIQDVRIAVNAAAARPLRLKAVEDAVRGHARDSATGEMAGKLAVEGAVPLQFNAYKIPLMRNLVKRSITGVQEASWA